MTFIAVRLRTNEYGVHDDYRTVDQVELIGYDLHLRTDIRSERDVNLARRMADELGIPLHDIRRTR